MTLSCGGFVAVLAELQISTFEPESPSSQQSRSRIMVNITFALVNLDHSMRRPCSKQAISPAFSGMQSWPFRGSDVTKA